MSLRRTAARLTVPVLALTALGTLPARSAGVEPVTIAARRTDGRAITWQDGAWRSLDATLAATRPAVVDDGTRVHHLAVHPDGRVHHRTRTTPWTAVTSAGSCSDVDADLSSDGTALVVACTRPDGTPTTFRLAVDDPAPTPVDVTPLDGVVTDQAVSVITTLPENPLLPGLPAGPTFLARLPVPYTYTAADGTRRTDSLMVRTAGSPWVRTNGTLIPDCVATPDGEAHGRGLALACPGDDGALRLFTRDQKRWPTDEVRTLPGVTVARQRADVAVVDADPYDFGPARLTVAAQLADGTIAVNRSPSGSSWEPQPWKATHGVAISGHPGYARSTTALARGLGFARCAVADSGYVATGSDAGQIVGVDPVTRARTVLAPQGRDASITADGRKVAYISGSDAYVLDRPTGTRTLVVNDQADGYIRLSATGRYAVVGVHEDDPTDREIVLHDLQTGTRTVVGPGSGPSVSTDGRIVAFNTSQSLVPEDTNGVRDAYLWNRFTKAYTLLPLSGQNRVRLSADGTTVVGFRDRTLVVWRQGVRTDIAAPGRIFSATVSGNGRRIAFDSEYDATSDAARFDVYLWESGKGLNRLSNSHGQSYAPAISTDGRSVCFHSDSYDLVPGGSGGPYPKAADLLLRRL